MLGTRFLKLLTIAVAVLAAPIPVLAEPLQHRCQTSIAGIEVRILGQRGDLIEIHDTQSGVFYDAHEEGRAEMGGKSGELNCGDVFSNSTMIVLRTGWKNDYAHMYGVVRENDGSVTLSQYRWLPQDHPIDVIQFAFNGGGPSVQLRNGRNDDRYYQVCFDRLNGWRDSSTPNQFTNGWRDCNRSLNVPNLNLELASGDPGSAPYQIPGGPLCRGNACRVITYESGAVCTEITNRSGHLVEVKFGVYTILIPANDSRYVQRLDGTGRCQTTFVVSNFTANRR